jgi:hypothetical protein
MSFCISHILVWLHRTVGPVRMRVDLGHINEAGKLDGKSERRFVLHTPLSDVSCTARSQSASFYVLSSPVQRTMIPRGGFSDGPQSWVWRVAKCSFSHDEQGQKTRRMAGSKRYGRCEAVRTDVAWRSFF